MQPSGPIVIAGFMACGKTVLASALADRLNCKMIDLDEVITKREGRSPAEIIEGDGESAFRTIETIALQDVLKDGSVGVIALGGGAWISDASRQLIGQYASISVWLDTPFEVCWERIVLSEVVRPLGRSKEKAQKLYERRRSVYELADLRLEAYEGVSIDKLAREIEGHVVHPKVT
jgi:shikimate kinase